MSKSVIQRDEMMSLEESGSDSSARSIVRHNSKSYDVS